MEALLLRAKTALHQAFSAGLDMFWREVISELPWNELQDSQRQTGDRWIYSARVNEIHSSFLCLSVRRHPNSNLLVLKAGRMSWTHTSQRKLHRIRNDCAFRPGFSLLFYMCVRLSLLWSLVFPPKIQKISIALLFCPKKELFETETSSHPSCHKATRTDSIIVTQVKR